MRRERESEREGENINNYFLIFSSLFILSISAVANEEIEIPPQVTSISPESLPKRPKRPMRPKSDLAENHPR